MKIVGVDNFARDNVSDFLAAENIRSEGQAEVMCKALNDKFCNSDFAPTYYRVEPDDYVLFKWEP